jgi:UDP:flavonoid glycosyltransferase YjiC (YdhE family)
VVLDIPGIPPGYGMELIQHAGCPCAANATELAKAVSRLLADDAYRRTCRAAAEEFVTQFCAYFGQDSAQRIAQSIRRRLAS